MVQPINLSPDINEWEPPEVVDFEGKPPKWLGETYPGIEKDIAKDLYSMIFWDMAARQAQTGKPYDLHDSTVKARLVSEAILKAAERSQNLQGDVQRSVYELIYLAKKTGAWQMGLYEYASMEEWLRSKLPNFEKGQYYDIKFLLDDLFPLLEQLGDTYHPENLLKFQEEWSKTRASIPYMRTLYNEYMASLAKSQVQEGSPEEAAVIRTFTEGIQNTLNVIADPEVKAWSGEKTIATELRGLRQVPKKIYVGYKGLMNGQAVFVFGVPEHLDMAVEGALRNVVEIRATDPNNLSHDLVNALLGTSE